MRLSFLLVFALLFPQLSFADETLRIRDYLRAVKGSNKLPEVTTQDSNPLLSELELRATLKDDQLDEVKFHLTPFAWGEREKLRDLSQLERGLLDASLKSKANESYYEIWKAILDLRTARREKLAFEDMIDTSSRLIKVMGGNSEELASRPDSYIEALSERQEFDHKLRETKAEIESLEASLGAVIGLSRVSLDYSALISVEAMKEEVLSSYLTVGQTDDQVKSLLAERATAEVDLELIKEHRLLNFFSVGTSFKPDGSRRALEVGVGMDLPIGTFPARMLELQRKKVMTVNDAEGTRVDRQREMKRLSTKILNRLASLNADDAKSGEQKMENVHQAITKTYGKSSLVALKSEFAIKKYRLEKLESVASLYEDFLALNFLKGRLEESGQPLVLP